MNNEHELLSNEYKIHLAFAEEKLSEIMDLKALSKNLNYKINPTYQNNVRLFKEMKRFEDKEIHAKVSSLSDRDFTRLPSLNERLSTLGTIYIDELKTLFKIAN